MNVRDELFSNADSNYKDFSSSLLPTVDKERIIGVRLPVLRKIAKSAYSENIDFECFYYEEIMLRGFTIGMKKCSLDEHIREISAFVPLIDNWSVCDSFASSLKFTAKYRDEMYDFLLSFLEKGEYYDRFCVVMLMDYYLVDDCIEKVLLVLKSVRSNYYYVNMAVSWALSEAFIKYPKMVLPLIKSRELPSFVQNKTISKICDSLRVEKSVKQALKKYKIKTAPQ